MPLYAKGVNMDIEKQLQSIKDNNHYLSKAYSEKLPYYDCFKQSINDLSKKLTDKQLEDLVTNKLQIKEGTFSEKPYIQSACETTVNSYFAKNYETSFQYELQINPNSNKNVECQIKDADYTYNIEVKCSSFEAKENIDKIDAFKFGTFGRMEDYKDAMKEIGDLMVEGQKKTGKDPKPLIELKKMDNNLKDFLVSAHQKFNPTPNENEVNILVVCCGDANDIQFWHNYMFAPQGLFTKGSYYNQNEYSLVDVVVLTNLYHRHNKYFDKQNLVGIWDFSEAFNLVFSNPFRKLNKENSIKHFLEIFPHYTNELAEHKIVLQNEPEIMRNILNSIVGIPDFVRINFTEKGKHLF